MRRFIVMAGLVVMASCGGSDQPANVEEKKDAPLVQSKNSESFNTAFAALLNSYYQLKDALVATDTTAANTAASALASNADSLKLNELNADSSIVDMAQGNVGSISAEAKSLVSSAGVEEKRKSFQLISENMYDLVRTVRYDREVVYHAFCPMYNDDQGGYWLSSSADIRNPYFGKKMLTCGEVKDSIDFRGK